MIEIINATKILKGKTVLDQINLQLQEGDFILLKGPNGCGKTMLLRMICGLITPGSGEIKSDKAYTCGVIIENPSFFEGETAKYNLKYLASLNHRITDLEIDRYLQMFDLFEERNKKVRTFSLGMKQRLALIQAMMEDPDILLLDEPFNAIDDENLENVYHILNEFHKRNKMIVVASHGDHSDKCEFNRVIQMNRGKIKTD